MATIASKQQQGTYTFASQPRAVHQRKKYRDTQQAQQVQPQQEQWVF